MRPERFLFVAAILAALSGCGHTVNDYLAEAKEGSPGAVTEAVAAVGEVLKQKEDAGLPFDAADKEALLYIKDVAATKREPTSRAAALRALAELRNADAADVFRAALKDSFWLARLHAIVGVEQNPSPGVLEPLREVATSDPRPEVRRTAVRAIKAVGGKDALRVLLEIYLDPPQADRQSQLLAYRGVRELSGQSFSFDEQGQWRVFYDKTYRAAAAPPPRGP